jgi:hypothetical protein
LRLQHGILWQYADQVAEKQHYHIAQPLPDAGATPAFIDTSVAQHEHSLFFALPSLTHQACFDIFCHCCTTSDVATK